MNKEFHWFEDYSDLLDVIFSSDSLINGRPLEESVICRSYHETKIAFSLRKPLIISTQSAFFRQELLDCGYRLFAHPAHHPMTEFARGQYTNSGALITDKSDLEKLLLEGEL